MELQSQTTLAALLGPELDVSLQVRWAVRLASAHKLDLLILHRVASADDHVEEIFLDKPQEAETESFIDELRSIVEASTELHAEPRESAGRDEAEQSETHDVHVRLKLIHFKSLASLRSAVLAELHDKDVEMFTQARAQITDTSDIDLVRERRLFLRYIPCKVVLCLGLQQDTALSRILVATAPGPNGSAALQLGAQLSVAANGTLTALHVNPGVGVEAVQVGEQRLERNIKKSLTTEYPAVNRRVVVDDQVPRGIRGVWEEGGHDLIVMGVSGSHIEDSPGTKLGKEAVVVLVSTVSPIGNRFKQFVDEVVQLYVPQIEREDRVALVDRMQSSAAWNFDFAALMVLSTIMAAIGLIQNSAAVVIGAMLVAPLMTPIMGLGLSLVQGNPVLAGLSLRSVVLGLCVSIICGFLVGFATPGLEEPTREMLARGGPGLLDLLVAFAAGIAAAYASSRPSLIAALPGVAIAAALVPPIATSGLALSIGDFYLAFGAMLLFAINMVTIILASMLSLWAVGFRNLRKVSSWTLMGGSVIIVAVLALGLYLSLQHIEYELAEGVPEGLVEAVQENLGSSHRLEHVAVAYDELGLQLNLHVVGTEPVSEELASEVRIMARDHYNYPVRVRLMTLIEIDHGSAE